MDAECKIITELWQASPLMITLLVNLFKKDCDKSKITVITLLNRMESKGEIYFKDSLKARQYYPAITRSELVSTETNSYIAKDYNGNVGL